MVTFSNIGSPLRARVLGADVEVLAGQIPFRTENGLDVLPIEAKVFFKGPSTAIEDPDTLILYEQLYASLGEESSSDFAFYETAEQEPASETGHPDHRFIRHGGRPPVGGVAGAGGCHGGRGARRDRQ